METKDRRGLVVAASVAAAGSLAASSAGAVPVTLARCAAAWNASAPQAERAQVVRATARSASILLADLYTIVWDRSHTKSAHWPTCDIVFFSPGGDLQTSGRWTRDRQIHWSSIRPAVFHDGPRNARVLSGGRLRLR
jgi:hypothetical protein